MAFRKVKFSFYSTIKSLGPNTSRTLRKYSSFVHSKRLTNKNSLIAFGTALGISLYFAHKNKILCDIQEVQEIVVEKGVEEEKNYETAIKKSRDILQRVKDEVGVPGLVVGVSIDGNTIWEEGVGYADVENRVLCTPNTVMRIASISKSITMAAVAKLWEQGKLDIDKPVQEYVPYFPQKTFNGKPVTITCRQLVSHLGGIRHYTIEKSDSKKSDSKNSLKSNDVKKLSEMEEMKEFYITAKYADVKSAVGIFKDDPLVEEPGTKYHYSTHAWTLISAIVEEVSKEKFTTHITQLFKSLGMKNTFLDENEPIIYHRSRYYMKNEKGVLVNTPYVDNSCKWAGGGFLSTVGDLIRFGNAMLYSAQSSLSDKNSGKALESKNINKSFTNIPQQNKLLPGYLKSKTMEAMWSPGGNAAPKYGMGWALSPEKHEYQFCEDSKFYAFHTGGAVGASSVLLISPKYSANKNPTQNSSLPQGTIVVILTNMHNIPLAKTASKIATLFENV